MRPFAYVDYQTHCSQFSLYVPQVLRVSAYDNAALLVSSSIERVKEIESRRVCAEASRDTVVVLSPARPIAMPRIYTWRANRIRQYQFACPPVVGWLRSGNSSTPLQYR